MERNLYDLSHVSDIALLEELIRRNGTETSPIRLVRSLPCRSVWIGVGDDHTAEIVIYEDALEELENIILGWKKR